MGLNNCQVNCCTNAARVELAVGPGLVLDVCRKCATEETARAFGTGRNIGLYTFHGNRVVVSCEGEPPVPRQLAYVDGVRRWCDAPSPWSAYMLPCLGCKEEFVYDPTGRLGRQSLFCSDCEPDVDEPPAITPPITEEQAAEEAYAYAKSRIDEGNMSAKDEIASFDHHKEPWGDAKPLWDHLETPILRQAAKDAYEERAAIMEHDGELTRIEAEADAYREVADKAVEAKLIKHEQLGLFK